MVTPLPIQHVNWDKTVRHVKTQDVSSSWNDISGFMLYYNPVKTKPVFLDWLLKTFIYQHKADIPSIDRVRYEDGYFSGPHKVLINSSCKNIWRMIDEDGTVVSSGMMPRTTVYDVYFIRKSDAVLAKLQHEER